MKTPVLVVRVLSCFPFTCWRRLLILAAALPLCFLTACRKDEALQQEDPFRVFMHKNRMDGTLFSANEDRVLYGFSTNSIVNVFSFDTDSGMATQITNSKYGAKPISFFTDDQVIYSDRPEGASVEHLFLKARDGAVTDLTPWPGVQSVFYHWGGKHQIFYFGSNKEDRRFLYVYRMNPAERLPNTVLQTQDMRFIVASPDHRYLALWKYSSPSQSDVYLYDMERKLLAKIAPEEGASLAVPQFFEGPSHLYYLSNASGRVGLIKFDLDSRQHQKVDLATGGSIVYARKSPTGKFLVVGSLKDGTLRSSVFRQEKGDGYAPVLTDRQGTVLDISSSEKWLLQASVPESTTRGLNLVNLETLQSRKILPD